MARTLADLRTERDEIDAAIRAITVDNAMVVSIGDRSVTRPNLQNLNRQRNRLTMQINQLESNGAALWAQTVRVVPDTESTDG